MFGSSLFGAPLYGEGDDSLATFTGTADVEIVVAPPVTMIAVPPSVTGITVRPPVSEIEV